MISLTTEWYVWLVLIANVFAIGALVGQWDTSRRARRSGQVQSADSENSKP